MLNYYYRFIVRIPIVCCCLPLSLASGGVRSSRLWTIWPTVLSLPVGSVHKSRGDNVVRMWMQLKRCCVGGCYKGGGNNGDDVRKLTGHNSRKIQSPLSLRPPYPPT